jgi:hypothetical protein
MQVSAPISSDKTEPQQPRTHLLFVLFSSSILCCPTLAVTDAVLVALYPNGLLQKLGKEICCCARWSHIGAEAPALAAAPSREKKRRRKKGKTKEHTSKERNVRKTGNIVDLLSKQERDRERKR